MGTPADAKPVRFFVSLIYQETVQMPEIENKLVSFLGEILLRTDPVPFLHTTYYEKEMGSGLLRYFLLFKPLRAREKLPSVKLMTNEIESNTSEKGKRTINIDPGYITLEQVILATTKGFTHRIYLSKGIFADLTLIYTNGTFGSLPWTYPDYGGVEMISMLNSWREEYKADLRGGFLHGNSSHAK
jgi:hypothetical protein